MKKVISISLTLLMLVSNIGFAMNTHFCGGKAVETTFTLGLGNPDCGMEDMEQECENMPSEEEQIKAKPCCENHHQVIQTDDIAKTQPSTSVVNPLFFTAFVQVFIQPLFFVDKRQSEYSEYPPPFFERDVQVLFQTFLI